MLILSRKLNERICIKAAGMDIIIMVTGIHSDKVRLGVQAPMEVTVHREEVIKAIEQDKIAAQTTLTRKSRRDPGVPRA